jgi:Zn finger protein HypA/HybF involved in hydrogenase expression
MTSKYSKEMLEPIVIESISIAEVLKKLGLKYAGGNYAYVKKMIDKCGISTSHFLGQGHNKGKKAINAYTKETFIKELLKESENGSKGTFLKKMLFKFELKKDVCEVCGISEWMNKKLSLQLEHINGNHFDNRLENLKILCPNCHSQTETYSGKKNKRK